MSDKETSVPRGQDASQQEPHLPLKLMAKMETGMQEEIDRLKAENARLRELYENATGCREKFGWTINHLLEGDEALRTVEEASSRLVDLVREAAPFVNAVAVMAKDKTPALSWLAKAATEVGDDSGVRGQEHPPA
jgi:hypothetical protein